MDYSVSYFTNMLQVDKALHYFGVGFFCFIWVFLFFFIYAVGICIRM